MANIPIRDIPGAVVASPDPSNLIPMDNGSLMQKTTIENAVNTTLPLSSQVEAEAGADNVKRMSPLRTKQAIDAQTPVIVNTAITALNLSTMSQEDASDYTPTSGLAAVALSNDYDDLDNLPTLGTAAATDASDYATAAQGALADTAIQPGDAELVPSGGTIGQVLVKNSGTNYDTGWVSSASATAVSYAPQTLTDAQQEQARENIGIAYDDLPWLSVPIGGIVELPTNIAGVVEPPTDSALYRFAKLTAGLTGGGAYNNGILTSESVSGSAPLVLATATVSLAGSPINGQTIRLLNTEGRFIRPGTSAGTVANDTMQDHDHPQIGRSSVAGTQYGQTNAHGTTAVGPTGMASTNGWRTGTETAPKHIQLTHYMRIK